MAVNQVNPTVALQSVQMNCDSIKEGASKAVKWAGRTASNWSTSVGNFAKKIADFSKGYFEKFVEAMKTAFTKTRDFSVRNVDKIRDYLKTHPDQVKVAGITFAIAFAISALGYLLCCRKSPASEEQTPQAAPNQETETPAPDAVRV